MYKNQGWSGFGDWLGNNKVANQDKVFMSYLEAKEYVKSLNLNSQREWTEYNKTNIRPEGIPRNPAQTYKNSGWISWPDWLGTSK